MNGVPFVNSGPQMQVFFAEFDVHLGTVLSEQVGGCVCTHGSQVPAQLLSKLCFAVIYMHV